MTYPFVLSWSMLEAMAKECLVVASDTAPVREVIRNGKNGFLVEYGDAAALAKVVVDALGKGEKLDSVRKAARKTVVERYDLKTISLPLQKEIIEKLGRGEMPNATKSIPTDIAKAMGWDATKTSELTLWDEMSA